MISSDPLLSQQEFYFHNSFRKLWRISLLYRKCHVYAAFAPNITLYIRPSAYKSLGPTHYKLLGPTRKCPGVPVGHTATGITKKILKSLLVAVFSRLVRETSYSIIVFFFALNHGSNQQEAPTYSQ